MHSKMCGKNSACFLVSDEVISAQDFRTEVSKVSLMVRTFDNITFKVN